MKCVHTKQTYVPLSRCDYSGQLSLTDVFSACQDIATEHAELLGFGGDAMAAKGLFWMTARTRVHIYRRPAMLTEYAIETWPAAPGATRCDRFYRASNGDEVLFEGRTEWCVWDFRAGRTVSPAPLFDDSFDFREDTVLAAPYARFRHNFTDEDVVFSYRVSASDIDIGRHMNNVAYPRMLLNSFSTKELAAMDIAEMEILFMMPTMEGDTLDICRRKTDTGYEFGARRSNGRYAALASITER